MRDYFRLTEYSGEFVDRIVSYRTKKDEVLNRYLSCEEIAKKEKCDERDVEKILSATAIVWNH